jgi:hypothetical protein
MLHSIDLPNHDPNSTYNFTKGVAETGWLVPTVLQQQWKLHLGDAKEILPQLISNNVIDIFFHDSDHSYEHMKWEFEIVYPAMAAGGLIISDDVHNNNAFAEFTERHGLAALTFNKGGCARRK